MSFSARKSQLERLYEMETGYFLSERNPAFIAGGGDSWAIIRRWEEGEPKEKILQDPELRDFLNLPEEVRARHVALYALVAFRDVGYYVLRERKLDFLIHFCGAGKWRLQASDAKGAALILIHILINKEDMNLSPSFFRYIRFLAHMIANSAAPGIENDEDILAAWRKTFRLPWESVRKEQYDNDGLFYPSEIVVLAALGKALGLNVREHPVIRQFVRFWREKRPVWRRFLNDLQPDLRRIVRRWQWQSYLRWERLGQVDWRMILQRLSPAERAEFAVSMMRVLFMDKVMGEKGCRCLWIGKVHPWKYTANLEIFLPLSAPMWNRRVDFTREQALEIVRLHPKGEFSHSFYLPKSVSFVRQLMAPLGQEDVELVYPLLQLMPVKLREKVDDVLFRPAPATRKAPGKKERAAYTVAAVPKELRLFWQLFQERLQATDGAWYHLENTEHEGRLLDDYHGQLMPHETPLEELVTWFADWLHGGVDLRKEAEALARLARRKLQECERLAAGEGIPVDISEIHYRFLQWVEKKGPQDDKYNPFIGFPDCGHARTHFGLYRRLELSMPREQRSVISPYLTGARADAQLRLMQQTPWWKRVLDKYFTHEMRLQSGLVEYARQSGYKPGGVNFMPREAVVAGEREFLQAFLPVAELLHATARLHAVLPLLRNRKEGARPKKGWLKKMPDLAAAPFGAHEVAEQLKWMALAKRANPKLPFLKTMIKTSKALAWSSITLSSAEIGPGLEAAAMECFVPVPDVGLPAEGLGLACIWALCNMKDRGGLPYLMKLRENVRYPKVHAYIDKLLHETR